jgi:D-alanyl-lipoteichoic acid acyltransferase DltB (MBOAT superfamily)
MFVHNRWSDWAGQRFPPQTGWRGALLNGLGVLVTFHFVALGWVFFALPDLPAALRVFALLF